MGFLKVGISLAVAALFLGGFESALAESFPMNPAPHCYVRDVAKINVPLYPGNPASPAFSLSYKRFPGNGSTTVIVLPGGPGDTLLEHSPTESKYPYGAVSTDQFNIVYTEPRGLGCNQLGSGDFPVDAFRVAYLANDIVEIVRKENLKNYIIYGASFGTVHASYVAHLLGIAGLPLPKAIVLEGTLGRGVPGRFPEYISGFANEWARVRELLPPSMANLFSGTSLPLGYAPNVWGAFLFKLLITGDVPHYGPWLQSELQPLLTENKAGLQILKSKLDGFQKWLALPPLLRIPRIFQVLACRELFGGWQPEVVVERGHLGGSGENICGLFDYVPYDSANLSLSSPIVYFQGPFDPATPLASARYHFEHQGRAPRTFVTVGGASHAPLSNSLVTLGCNKNVWAQIDKDPRDLSAALATCGDWKIEIEFRAAADK